MEKVWVIVAKSCNDCNSLGVKALTHKPTDEEINGVARDIGGMYCISSKVFEATIDGETVEKDVD